MSESEAALVLAVDDHPDTLLLTERFLKGAGYRVITAESGPSALELLQRTKPDLILLDVMMPGMDGYQVCHRIQQDPRLALVPVIFATGLSEAQDRARALAAGGVDYVVKPVRKDTLVGIVRQHLETRSRWYSVESATDLWDEVPLPKKFAQFRDMLVERLRLEPETAARLQGITATNVYDFADALNVEEPALAQYMADFFGMPFVDEIRPGTIKLGVLPPSFCRMHSVVAIDEESLGPAFVISNPFVWGLAELDVLNRAYDRQPYRLLLTARKTIAQLFYEGAEPAREPDGRTATVDVVEFRQLSVEQLLREASQATPMEIVNSLISDAVGKGASDLHIEPEKDRIRVRYRIDGRMRPVMPLISAHLPGVVARIKVMSNMDLSESRKPQDGGMMLRVDGREIEIRTSTLPTTHGEKVVLRIMGGQVSYQNLDAVGFVNNHLRDFKRLLMARQGMLLITGPTGSGKTTTLYSALGHLNSEEINIVTVEDPVEADLPGITQVQVHERAGRSFANVLRAMLRQDPDVVMVGEIRDAETAEIACRAALTGHLVLSTVHTQNTLGTVVRLFDMGVAPYLAASALNGVVAQRLANRVCDSCDADYPLPAPLRRAFERRFGDLQGARFRRGVGCPRCLRTGTRGRVGIFELLTIDEDLRSLLTEGAAPSVLREHVTRLGFRTLEEDAFQKACRGLIPPEAVVDLGFGVAQDVHFEEAEQEDEPASA